MAGDIQEPLRLSFQADYIHSGSISFGRFETEALCWERRSSFSHNRYLEEVERCSKPGSVTAKKAYFEAHFKRKALLNKNSLESQNGIDSPTRENENLQDMFEGGIEHLNKDSPGCNQNYDQSGCDQSEMTEYGFHYLECMEPAVTNTVDNFSSEEVIVNESLSIDEAYEDESGNSSQSNVEPENEVTKNLNGSGEAPNSDRPLNSGNLVPASSVSNMGDCMNGGLSVSLEVEIGSQMEIENSNSTMAQPSFFEGKKNISSEPSFPAHNANREIPTPSRSRKVKPIPGSATSTSPSVPKSLKNEAFKSSKTKLHESKRSGPVKESTLKTTANSRPSTSEKVASRLQQNANRSIRSENSEKPILKQNGLVISFRSDERAERRKEFNTKIEEKMLAKETEAQQVKAKKQEKSEEDLKQLRKSLNFRATPMPSFYTEAGHTFDKSKVVARKGKTSKVQSKAAGSSTAGSSERPLSSQSMGIREARFAAGSQRNKSLQLSRETNHPSADIRKSKTNTLVLADADADSNSHQNQAALHRTSGRKEQHNEVKVSGLQNHRVLGTTEMNKDKKITKNNKVGAERKKGVMRKDITGIGLRNSSRIGNVAVGVTS